MFISFKPHVNQLHVKAFIIARTNTQQEDTNAECMYTKNLHKIRSDLSKYCIHLIIKSLLFVEHIASFRTLLFVTGIFFAQHPSKMTQAVHSPLQFLFLCAVSVEKYIIDRYPANVYSWGKMFVLFEYVDSSIIVLHIKFSLEYISSNQKRKMSDRFPQC